MSKQVEVVSLAGRLRRADWPLLRLRLAGVGVVRRVFRPENEGSEWRAEVSGWMEAPSALTRLVEALDAGRHDPAHVNLLGMAPAVVAIYADNGGREYRLVELASEPEGTLIRLEDGHLWAEPEVAELLLPSTS